MTLIEYIQSINSRLAEGHTSEHTFRGDFEALLRTQLPNYHITNEPSQITDCGNPDFVITMKKIPVGYIEAKDIGKDLKHKQYKEQFDRYRKALDNLIITDYVNFQFFENGELVNKIKLGEYSEENKLVEADQDQFNKFSNLIQDFATNITQSIKSPLKLAELMAGKARLLENILEEALTRDIEKERTSPLTDQYNSFKQMLIHDLNPKGFADLYAQTLAYGLFAARYHDPSLPTFDRDEAARLIPQNNPLLRNLFQSIAGYNIDPRIETTVDNLAEVFRHADVKSILEGYGKKTAQHDPVIHFYETFLAKYDAKLRKAKGVWYTPQPVVSFIVRAVDDILKTKFGLQDGLADSSKTTIEVEAHEGADQNQSFKKRKGKLYGTKEVHKVQILDPATGTGTFLAEIISHLYQTRFQHMQGVWPEYVKNDLIPRLNGFELLMASYAMAHLKMDILLGETGCDSHELQDRLRIFLTNSLEEYHPDTHTLFASWLSDEAREANAVKKETPVMVVMGNPPYSVSSSNKGDWIQELTKDYKKDLNERNIQPLSDDYIKFIRYGQYFIEKNGEGILAFITNNSFIDGLIHRQMRKHLLQTFDEIYILDLHGNAQKKEVCPDGSIDQNVFDIMQGVSINIFVKTGGKKKLGEVFHFDLFGKRESKYAYLDENKLISVDWSKLKLSDPNYYFVKKDFKGSASYEQGIKIDEMFINNNTGLNTEFDELAIQNNKNDSEKILEILKTNAESEVINLLKFNENKIEKVRKAILDIKKNNPQIVKIKIKPFEEKFCIYTGKSNGIMGRPRHEIMRHLLNGENLGLISMRQYAYDVPHHCYTFISRQIVTSRLFMSNKGYCSAFPLYLYTDDNTERIPNLNPEKIKAFEKALKLPFVAEKENSSEQPESFAPIDILDYIYAVLHSPNYRETYKEFLKTDFPRVPYPKPKTFWQLVELGGQIRQLHLLEAPELENSITAYPENGDNIVSRKITKTSPGYESISETHGKVWINDQQYFDNVPLLAWEFYIGGYQPAQKWLKDRHGRELSFDDIRHYQKIIVALVETHRLMQEIDKVLVI